MIPGNDFGPDVANSGAKPPTDQSDLSVSQHSIELESDQQSLNTTAPELTDAIEFEAAALNGHTFNLPVELCENPLIFEEFFSIDTWNALGATAQQHLHQFLPQFAHLSPAENHAEQQHTVLALLGGNPEARHRIDRFGNAPMAQIQANLEAGNYRPDIARARARIEHQKRRERRFQEAERISRMAKELLVRRERLLHAYDTTAPGRPAGSAPNTDWGLASKSHSRWSTSKSSVETSLKERSRKRYYDELASIAKRAGVVGEPEFDEAYSASGGRKKFWGLEGMPRKSTKCLPTEQVNQ